MQDSWSTIPTMRMGVNYYLKYSQDYVSENDTGKHEELYWGVSFNVVNGIYECDYYGAGYAVPEPYMSEMQNLALSRGEIKSLSENIFGEDKYKLDFYIRELDEDNITYIYRKNDTGYYRYIEPVDEYDEFTSLRPEYIQNLKSIGNRQLQGTYTTSRDVMYDVIITLHEKYNLPISMQFVSNKSMYSNGLKVDWQKVDYTFYDFTTELKMTDEIYKEAKESLPISVSSSMLDMTGNYYLIRYFTDYKQGEEIITDTGDSYYKYSDTYFFSIPEDVTMYVTFTIPPIESLSVDEVVCLNSENIMTPLYEYDGMWKTNKKVTGEEEFQFVVIENNNNTTFTFTGNYMLERIVSNVPGTRVTSLSSNAVDGTQIRYRDQNIVIEEQSLMKGQDPIYLTEPFDVNQRINYTSDINGDVDLASAAFARNMAAIDGVSDNDIADYIYYYRHNPTYELEQEVLDYFNTIRPLTDYLFSIYDITTYDLVHSDMSNNIRFFGYSDNRKTCISLSLIYNDVNTQPTFYYAITQLYNLEE